MKKFTNFIFVLIILITLCGCRGNNEDPGTNPDKGVTPTHDFSVDAYLQDNAIFPQNEEFVISGVSENGVLLKVDIYDEKDSLIKTASSSRFFSVSFLLSSTPTIRSFNGIITLAQTTGPASGPRPTSSTPAIYL